jgi:hypothetical protein
VEEVQLWRGLLNGDPYAPRAGSSVSFTTSINNSASRNWTAKTVLDFGGNRRNLLIDSIDRIRSQAYYCVEVIKEAIDEGRRRFPEAHWVHYNRYNCSFNPEGTADLLIPELAPCPEKDCAIEKKS